MLLSGEAGIGKSRLTAALLERVATEPHTRLRYFCSPQHTDSALYPIISQMERAAGFAHDDTAQAKLDKLDAVLAQSLTLRQDAMLFANMLSLTSDGRYPALDLSPQQRRQRTLEALLTTIPAKTRLGNRDRLFAAGVSRGAQLADHKGMRSINVKSSSGARELATEFKTIVVHSPSRGLAHCRTRCREPFF